MKVEAFANMFYPVEAISMISFVAGELMCYNNREKVFSTAQLKMGSGTTGMLGSNYSRSRLLIRNSG